MSAAKIAVLGDLIIDIQTGPMDHMPHWNTAVLVENVKVLLGGSAALGNETRLFSVIGEDNLSKMAVNQLLDEGKVDIDDSLITISNTLLPKAIILYGVKKRSLIYNYNGALKNFTADHINKALIFKYDHLHIAGYFICSPEFIEVIKEAKKNRMTVSMQPQMDPKQEWVGANGNLAEILPLLDVFIPSKLDAYGITKKSTMEESVSALRKLMPRGLIMIEDGENGVHFSTENDVDGGTTNVHPFRSEIVVDTTGSRSSLIAGFLHKWVQQKNGRRSKTEEREYITKAITYGLATAKFCVENFGAYVDHFSKEDVDNLVLKN